MSACLRFTRRVWKSFIENQGHDAKCFPNLSIERAIPGVVETSLLIEPYNCRVETVHGGLILSLTDTIGSLALATKGHYMTGVSTNIGTTFVKPAGRVGDILKIRAVVSGMGKTLAFTRVDFHNNAGDLVAYGHHTKFIGKSINHPKNVKLSEDGETVLEGEDVNVD